MACTDFLKGRGEKKGNLARVLAPKRAVYHVLTSQGGSLVCFANHEGTLACFFVSQEGTLVHVYQQFGHRLLVHITVSGFSMGHIGVSSRLLGFVHSSSSIWNPHN